MTLTPKRLGFAFLASMMLAISPVQADETSDRIDAMKSIGGALKTLNPMTKDPANFVAADAISTSQSIVASLETFKASFTSSEISDKSRALPAIFDNAEAWDAEVMAALEKASAIVAAAEAEDTDAFKAAFRTFTGTCRSCHTEFRGPEK